MFRAKGGRLFGLGARPAKVGSPSLTAGDATDTFTWIAPSNNGLPITKYGYQTTTDNGSNWSVETETANLSAIVSTQYSASNHKIRIRAFNAAGYGEYSDISSGTVAWTNVTGTDTDTDTACGPAGCSETDTDTACGPAGCTESQSQSCDCGTQSRSRSRTSSRTRTRSRTSSRTRTRSTQQYTRAGSTSSTITYGSYTGYSDYTYSAWSAYSAYTDYTYTAYPAYGDYGACSGSSTDVTGTGTFNGVAYTATSDFLGNGPYMYRNSNRVGSCNAQFGSMYDQCYSAYSCNGVITIVDEGCIRTRFK